LPDIWQGSFIISFKAGNVLYTGLALLYVPVYVALTGLALALALRSWRF